LRILGSPYRFLFTAAQNFFRPILVANLAPYLSDTGEFSHDKPAECQTN
jgi:hypothetical protein